LRCCRSRRARVWAVLWRPSWGRCGACLCHPSLLPASLRTEITALRQVVDSATVGMETSPASLPLCPALPQTGIGVPLGRGTLPCASRRASPPRQRHSVLLFHQPEPPTLTAHACPCFRSPWHGLVKHPPRPMIEPPVISHFAQLGQGQSNSLQSRLVVRVA
jgi:hypothetical protein